MPDVAPNQTDPIHMISNQQLQLSLVSLQEAAEKVWSNDAPRILHDYTDHGTAHSLRVMDHVRQLLAANEGSPLSEPQIYLLVAAAFLHDIGMQCDVVKWPDIRTRSQDFGATYTVDFTAETASTYSTQEQIAIRQNHTLLTAAWIDYAYQTGNTELGPPIKTVPSVLVADLIDVCKYHSRLPIDDCPLFLSSYPSHGKRIVAALLRFADELDIDSRRAYLSAVKTFQLDPQNAVYWWLHNLTTVTFTAKNVVLVTVHLQPEDANQYGPIVQAALIDEFRLKNRSVIDVLRQNGFRLAIDADSQVTEDAYASPLPDDVASYLNEIQADPNLHQFSVPASSEVGLNTDIHLVPGTRLSLGASGIISFDGGQHFTNADGLLTSPRGHLLFHPQFLMAAQWPHPEAYRTDGDRLGIIGSLFAWIGDYSEQTALLVGEGKEFVAEHAGFLHLMVNDAKGTYDDNQGTFQVRLRLLPPAETVQPVK